MRIAFFTDAFLPQINGVVTYITETANRLVLNGHEVIIFAPKPKRGSRLDQSSFLYKLILLPSLPAFVYPEARITLPSLPRVLYNLRKFNVDLIHIQTPFSVGTEGLIAGKLLKIPIVTTFHSFYIDKPFLEDFKLDKLSERLQNPLWKLYVSFYNLSDEVVCPTKIAQKELHKYGLKKPCVFIPHGINLVAIKTGLQAEVSGIRQNLHLKSDDKVAIFTGRLAADKRIDLLIKVWKKVILRIPNAKLIIIGTGPNEEILKGMVNKFKLKGNVIFTGAIKRENLIENGYLRIGQIAVSASKIENPSYSLLEEMAFGLPIVAFSMRGIPEIVNKENGMLVVPDDINSFAENVVKLFSDPVKLKKLSIGAKNKALEFDLKHNIESLEEIYSNLLKRKSRDNL